MTTQQGGYFLKVLVPHISNQRIWTRWLFKFVIFPTTIYLPNCSSQKSRSHSEFLLSPYFPNLSPLTTKITSPSLPHLSVWKFSFLPFAQTIESFWLFTFSHNPVVIDHYILWILPLNLYRIQPLNNTFITATQIQTTITSSLDYWNSLFKWSLCFLSYSFTIYYPHSSKNGPVKI